MDDEQSMERALMNFRVYQVYYIACLIGIRIVTGDRLEQTMKPRLRQTTS